MEPAQYLAAIDLADDLPVDNTLMPNPVRGENDVRSTIEMFRVFDAPEAGVLLAQSRPGSDDNIESIKLSTTDSAEVWIEAVDAAGNRSGDRVRAATEWVVTPNGRTNSFSSNPTTLWAGSSFTAPLGLDRTNVFSSGSELGSGDGVYMDPRVGLWQKAGQDPEGDGNPDASYGYALTFDSARGVGVLFGGWGAVFSDTWEYDGGSWREVIATDPEGDGDPVGRWFHALTYDSARGVTILFGGEENWPHSELSDTWE